MRGFVVRKKEGKHCIDVKLIDASEELSALEARKYYYH
jgi:hypothetical protein